MIPKLDKTPASKSTLFTEEKRKKDKVDDLIKENPQANPAGHLDKEAFMKLLLVQLQHQDPTSPMDTDKMLTQTSQLAALETQTNTNKIMKQLADKMEILSAGLSVTMIGAVGKMAVIKGAKEEHDGKGTSVETNVFMHEEPKTPVLFVLKDEKGAEVATFEKKPEIFQRFNNAMFYQPKDVNGDWVKEGKYELTYSYKDIQGNEHKGTAGSGWIDAVSFVDGKTRFKIGGKNVKFEDITEFKH